MEEVKTGGKMKEIKEKKKEHPNDFQQRSESNSFGSALAEQNEAKLKRKRK